VELTSGADEMRRWGEHMYRKLVMMTACLTVLAVSVLSVCCGTAKKESTATGGHIVGAWSIAELWAGSEPYIPPLFPARQDGKWGYIDREGRVVIEFQYDDADPFRGGLASVQVGKLWGYIDESGSMAITTQFEGARLFHGGLARVKTSAGWGYIDTTGEIAFFEDPSWVGSYDFSEGLAPVWLDKETDRYGYIDTSGNLVIRLGDGVTAADNFSEDLAAARQYGRWGYIDRSGEFVIEPQFYRASAFSGGRAVVEREWGEYAIIDSSGEVLRELDYNDVFPLSEERAAVSVGGWDTWLEQGGDPLDVEGWFGYIDETGALVIPTQYENAANFYGGLAQIEDENGKMGYIDLDGNYIWREK
jgi:hypothetical protein